MLASCAGTGHITPVIRPTGVIMQNTVWRGTVEADQDVLVPAGVTLVIEPGTTVKFSKSKSSQIEPRFLFTGHELLIRGNLQAAGTPEHPIIFASVAGDWAGIILDRVPAGGSWLSYCEIRQAETAIYCIGSSPRIANCTLENNGHGIVCQRSAAPEITGNEILYGDVGIGCWDNSTPLVADNCIAYQRQTGIMLEQKPGPWVEYNHIEHNRYGIFGSPRYTDNHFEQNEQDFYPDGTNGH